MIENDPCLGAERAPAPREAAPAQRCPGRMAAPAPAATMVSARRQPIRGRGVSILTSVLPGDLRRPERRAFVAPLAPRDQRWTGGRVVIEGLERARLVLAEHHR